MFFSYGDLPDLIYNELPDEPAICHKKKSPLAPLGWLFAKNAHRAFSLRSFPCHENLLRMNFFSLMHFDESPFTCCLKSDISAIAGEITPAMAEKLT